MWGLLYTNTMVRVEVGSGLDQRSRQAILAYIGSGHKSEVKTPTTNLRWASQYSCIDHFGFFLFPFRVSVQPSEMSSVEDLVVHSPFLVTVVVSRWGIFFSRVGGVLTEKTSLTHLIRNTIPEVAVISFSPSWARVALFCKRWDLVKWEKSRRRFIWAKFKA